MSDIFEGDPKLTLDENGSAMIFRGGQPVMDRGLENLALISLFTKRGWAGNIFFTDPNQRIESDFEEAANQPITLQSLNDIQDAAEKALSNPAFGNVTVTIINPNGYHTNVIIRMEPPGQNIIELFLSKNGLNWTAQANNPAYRRLGKDTGIITVYLITLNGDYLTTLAGDRLIRLIFPS